MARAKRRAGWRRIQAGRTLEEQLEGMEIVHRELAAEVKAEAQRAAGKMTAMISELGELQQEFMRLRKRQALDRVDTAAAEEAEDDRPVQTA